MQLKNKILVNQYHYLNVVRAIMAYEQNTELNWFRNTKPPLNNERRNKTINKAVHHAQHSSKLFNYKEKLIHGYNENYARRRQVPTCACVLTQGVAI